MPIPEEIFSELIFTPDFAEFLYEQARLSPATISLEHIVLRELFAEWLDCLDPAGNLRLFYLRRGPLYGAIEQNQSLKAARVSLERMFVEPPNPTSCHDICDLLANADSWPEEFETRLSKLFRRNPFLISSVEARFLYVVGMELTGRGDDSLLRAFHPNSKDLHLVGGVPGLTIATMRALHLPIWGIIDICKTGRFIDPGSLDDNVLAVRRNLLSPHWERGDGRVLAYEQVKLILQRCAGAKNLKTVFVANKLGPSEAKNIGLFRSHATNFGNDAATQAYQLFNELLRPKMTLTALLRYAQKHAESLDSTVIQEALEKLRNWRPDQGISMSRN